MTVINVVLSGNDSPKLSMLSMMMMMVIIIIIIIIIIKLQKTAILGTAHILRKVLM